MSEIELQSLKQLYRLLWKVEHVVRGLQNESIESEFRRFQIAVESRLGKIVTDLWFSDFDSELERQEEFEEEARK